MPIGISKSTLLLTLLSAVIIGIWLRQQNTETPTDDTSPAPPLLVVHEGKSHLYNVQGDTETIISAPLTHYYQDARGTQFTQPELQHKQNQAQIYLRADYAQQNQAKTQLQLEGNVFAKRQIGEDNSSRTEFFTDNMLYHLDKNEAETTAPVKILSADSTTHAIGTIWYLNQNLFILKQTVRSYYAPHHNF